VKTLIVNADDFGFTEDVNAGIVHAYQHGILTATTLMANGDAFADAVRLAKENPGLDVGCHFVLVGQGHSLVPPYKNLPPSVPRLAAAAYSGKIDIEAELEAQLRRIAAAGIQPVHIDAHKHTHLLPPVLDAIVKVAYRYGIRFIRRPFDLPIGYLPQGTPLSRRPTAMGMQLLRKRFARILASGNYRATDYFAGFQITGCFGTSDLVRVLQDLPEGSTEFMTHPGFCEEPLRKAHTRLKESRVAELEALTAKEVREAIEQNAIRLCGYRQLLSPHDAFAA
jgi:predicted glycoside hydrolase/deacetylase ChbG (UPF0249 family)